jgi:hopene-associated glycosyltransferase HpnB
MTIADIIGVGVLALWLYLILGRGGFWLGSTRDDPAPAAAVAARAASAWPAVVAVVPARNEADHVGDSIPALLRQDYAGPFHVVLIDDDSDDGTAAAAAELGGADRLTIVTGGALPAGWTGKLWALAQGIGRSEGLPVAPVYLLLTDADIVHAPDSVTALVARAQADGLVLTSLMAKLRCDSLAEKGLIPAFIFFFQMLYPFAWVNRPTSATAAAAGGCMLLRTAAFKEAGGMNAIRDAVIDDCALAKVMKARGPIWLGLTERVRSIRPYPGLEDIWRMVSRSAYAQLDYSPLLLLVAVAGLTLTFLTPPALALLAGGVARICGILAWGLMALAFVPTLRFYRVSPLWGIALPAIAFVYLLFTLDSAYQHARGRGGNWKGRFQAKVTQ